MVKKGGFFQKTLGAKDGTVRLLPGRADTYCCNRSKESTTQYWFDKSRVLTLTFLTFSPLFQFLSWPSALWASLSTMPTLNTPTSVEGGNRWFLMQTICGFWDITKRQWCQRKVHHCIFMLYNIHTGPPTDLNRAFVENCNNTTRCFWFGKKRNPTEKPCQHERGKTNHQRGISRNRVVHFLLIQTPRDSLIWSGGGGWVLVGKKQEIAEPHH